MARAIPLSVCRSSGSSVRLPAKLTAASVMVLPLSGAWPDGLPCPWNRGTVDTVACHQAARGKRWSQRSRPTESNCRPSVGSGARVGWWALAAGVGHARTVRPDPSTLGGVGERGSHHESCWQLVPGCLRWVLLRLVERHALAAVDPRATVRVPAPDQHPVL
jgi:hypothetical protein